MATQQFTGRARRKPTYQNINPSRGEPDREAPPQQLNLTPEDPAWVCVASNALHWDIYLFLDAEVPTPSGGGGGWTEQERPKDTAMTVWPGSPAEQLSVPIMIDSWIEDYDAPDTTRTRQPPKFGYVDKKRKRKAKRRRWRQHRNTRAPVDVEQHVDLVRKLQTGGAGPTRTENPPKLRLYGKALPHWLNGSVFVVGSIDWGVRLVHPNGKVKRQALILNLLVFEEGDDIEFRKKKKHSKNWKKHHHRVKRGETLMSIAKDEYGDWRKWKKIARANPKVKKPRDLDVGSVLKIP